MKKIYPEEIIKELDEHLSRNDYESARAHLLRFLSRAEENCDNAAKLLIFNELMGLCRKLGEEENALKFASLALALIGEMGIDQNIGAATTYLNSATVYKAFGRAKDAVPLFEKARKIYESSLNKTDPRLGGLYNNMALAMVDMGRFSDAEELYNLALAVMENIENGEPEQAITYLNIASAKEQELGLLDGAEEIAELCEKAWERLEKGKTRRDGNYAFVCEKCGPIFGYYGFFSYEAELKKRSDSIYERA